jgi:hypothetical protein
MVHFPGKDEGERRSSPATNTPRLFRWEATLRLLLLAAALLLGIRLLIWGCLICAITYIARCFVAASKKTWFLLLFGTAVPLVPLVSSGRWLAQIVLETGFPYLSPNELPDALRLLTVLYTLSIGLCLFAGVVDIFAFATAASLTKTAFRRRGSLVRPSRAGRVAGRHIRRLGGNLINVVSLIVLGWLLITNAIWVVRSTFVSDFDAAARAAEDGGSRRSPLLRNAISDANSSFAVAVALQARQPSSMCAGLGPQDTLSMLGRNRALVRRAATFYPEPGSEIYTWPLSRIEVIDCVRPGSRVELSHRGF